LFFEEDVEQIVTSMTKAQLLYAVCKTFQKGYADPGEGKWLKEKVDGPSHVISVGKRTVATGEW